MNFSGTAGASAIGHALNMVSGIVIARYLGPEQFGLFSYVLSIIAIATLPVYAGMPILLIREIATYLLDKKFALLNGIINWSRVHVLASSLVVGISMYCASYFIRIENSVSYLLLSAILLVPLKGMLIRQAGVLNGFGRPILAQSVQVIVTSSTLIILFFFIIFNVAELTPQKLFFIFIASSLLSCFITTISIDKIKDLSVKKCEPQYNIKTWNSSLLPFSIMVIVGTTNVELANVIIGWTGDHESVGYFRIAMLATGLLAIGLNSVNVVIGPQIAKLYKNGELEASQKLLTKSVRLSVLFTAPITLSIIILGEPLIWFLFGGNYLDAYPVLVILCLGALLNALMGSVALVLNMTGNEKPALISSIAALIINLILLLTLVPIYGAVGAAVSVLIGLGCWNVIMAANVWRLTKLKTWIR